MAEEAWEAAEVLVAWAAEAAWVVKAAMGTRAATAVLFFESLLRRH
ncbi:hypothetical protein [Clostridium transplantifaecale]|nr:hypothetical protein [Clostridium transplantifaecale]